MHKIIPSIVAFIICLYCGCGDLAAATFDTVHWRNPAPFGQEPSAIACGGGVCIAVGSAGMIMTSTDNENWTTRRSGTYSDLRGIVYSGGMFVIVGWDGKVLCSEDNGTTWKDKSIGSNYRLVSIAAGFAGFVAVGVDANNYTAAILTATDPRLSNWVVQNHGQASYAFYGVACSQDTIVAMGYGGKGAVFRNGLWQTVAPTTADLYAVTYGVGIFVTVGDKGVIMTSADGVTWAQQTSNVVKTLRAVAYGSGVFAAVGHSGMATVSANGVDWTPRNTYTVGDLTAITAGGPGLIAAGKNGALITSSDGAVWSCNTREATGNPLSVVFSGVTHGNGWFVAVGYGGIILVSPDGQSWSRSPAPVISDLYAVTYGVGHYCIVGAKGVILTSSDALHWSVRDSGTTQDLYGVAQGGGVFVAVGKNGVGVISADMKSWQTVTTGFTGDLRAVAYGLGRFAAVGNSIDGPSTWYTTSLDGSTWTPSPTISMYFQITGITVGENGFFAVGPGGGKALASINGQDWTMADVQPANYTTMTAIAQGNGSYLGVGYSGTIYGPNGNQWQAFPTGTLAIFYGVAYGNGSFVIVGSAGTILQTDAGNDSAPTLTAISVSGITANSAVIGWSSAEASTTQVEYQKWGESSWKLAVGDQSLRKDHQITLTGLDADTKYLFKAEGTAAGPIVAQVSGFSTLVRKETRKYLLTLKRKGQGTGTLAAPGLSCTEQVCTGLFDGGTSVTVQVEPEAGSEFLLWSADCQGEASSCTVTMDEDRTATAVIAQKPTTATPVEQSVWRRPYPQGNDLNSVIHAAGRYVAIGATGTAIASTDGVIWKLGYTGTRDRLVSLGYGNNLFVAITEKSGVLVSPDGLRWTIVHEGPGNSTSIAPIAYGNGRFIVYAYQTMTSFDGVEWTSRDNSGSVTDITYCGGVFVAVGQISTYSPYAMAQVSVDGQFWTDRSPVNPPANLTLTAVTCGQDGVFAIAYNGTTFRSENLVGWTITTPPPFPAGEPAFGLRDVATHAGRSVAVGTYGAILTADGNGAWTKVTSGSSDVFQSVAIGSARIVAVGMNGMLAQSDDGLSWQALNPGQNNNIWHVVFGNGVFVTDGTGVNPAQANTDTILSSGDGIFWGARKSGAFYGLAFTNNLFLGVGHSGTLYTSTDGENWTQAANTSWADNLYGAAYGNGRYVVVGTTNYPVVYTSTDAVTWTPRSFGNQGGTLSTFGFTGGITFGDGVFIALGNGWDNSKNRSYNFLFTSPDGETWTRVVSDVVDNSETFQDIIYVAGQKRFYVTGGSGIMISDDRGATWRYVSQKPCSGIAYGGGVFLATSGSNVLSSLDGETWNEYLLPTGKVLAGVAYGNNTFVITGENGTILQTGAFAGIVRSADVNHDGRDGTLADLLSTLRYLTGKDNDVPPSGFIVDVNEDHHTGPAEAVYILQSVRELR